MLVQERVGDALDQITYSMQTLSARSNTHFCLPPIYQFQKIYNVPTYKFIKFLHGYFQSKTSSNMKYFDFLRFKNNQVRIEPANEKKYTTNIQYSLNLPVYYRYNKEEYFLNSKSTIHNTSGFTIWTLDSLIHVIELISNLYNRPLSWSKNQKQKTVTVLQDFQLRLACSHTGDIYPTLTTCTY